MEYRQLPHGTENEKFSVLGLGMGGIGKTPAEEIEAIIRKAIDNGINFFDLCAAGSVYAPLGRAIRDCRDRVFLQCHFGAVYDENGEYGWCRDFDTIRKTFLWELETLGTDYVDFGFLHCVDQDEDFEKLVEIGVLDYLKELKAQGIEIFDVLQRNDAFHALEKVGGLVYTGPTGTNVNDVAVALLKG